MQKYGERLVCIWYRDRQGWRELEQCRSNCRYDAALGKRFKTVELIVEEEPWQAPEPHPDVAKSPSPVPRTLYTRHVGVRVAYHEVDMRNQIKSAGGQWDPRKKLWLVPESQVRRLGLVRRVVRR